MGARERAGCWLGSSDPEQALTQDFLGGSLTGGGEQIELTAGRKTLETEWP